MPRLSVITDEVSQSLREVVDFAHAFSLDAVELRSVGGRGPFAWDKAFVSEMARVFAGEGLEVCALSLPFFKCDLADDGARAEHMASLRRAMEHASRLNSRLLRGFCFWRTPGAPLPKEAVAEAYQPVIPRLRDAGMTMVIEADPAVHGHTARDMLALVTAIGDECVRVLWDGGNLLFADDGETPPEGYALLAPLVRHVHIKDAVRTPKGAEAVKVGAGEAQVAAQLRHLAADAYDGFLSLETHYRVNAALTEEQLRLPGGMQFSIGGLEASRESMEALVKLSKEVGLPCGK